MQDDFSMLEDLSDSSTKIHDDIFGLGLVDAIVPELSLADCFSETPGNFFCTICGTSITPASAIPTKRKKGFSSEQISSENRVCDECYELKSKTLSSKKEPSKSNRAAKRQQTKLRIQESEILQKLKLQQDSLLNNPDLSESERRKQNQQIRNRISAQISRDRKKEYITELEISKKALLSQNESLHLRIHQLECENKHLKRQLTDAHLSNVDRTSVPGLARALTFALATILSIMVVANSYASEFTSETRKLVQDIDLSEFRNTQGVSIQEAAATALQQIGVSIETFLPRSEAIAESVREFREKRSKQFSIANSLKTLAEPTEPTSVGLGSSETMDTLYCSNVFPSFTQGLQELKNLQVLVPTSSLPGMGIESKSPAHMVELTCKVSEVNILPLII